MAVSVFLTLGLSPGVKAELLEGGIRVPLFVRWPTKIKPGSHSSQVVSSIDFFPSLLAAAGEEDLELAMDGVNLLPQFLNQEPTIPRTLFWRFKAGNQAAVRHGDWKYLRLGGKEHLFNLVADPRERVLLKDSHPEVFARLKALYHDWNENMLSYPKESHTESVKNSYPDRY